VLRLVVRRYPLHTHILSPSLVNALTRLPRVFSRFYTSFIDIGSSNNVRGIERWTDGLKWGPSRVRDVSHCIVTACTAWLSSNGLLSYSMPPARLLNANLLAATHLLTRLYSSRTFCSIKKKIPAIAPLRESRPFTGPLAAHIVNRSSSFLFRPPPPTDPSLQIIPICLPVPAVSIGLITHPYWPAHDNPTLAPTLARRCPLPDTHESPYHHCPTTAP